MISLSILTLGIATLATYISMATKEEVVKVAMGCVAVLAGFIALCYLPWMLKLCVIAVPILLDRLNAWSADV